MLVVYMDDLYTNIIVKEIIYKGSRVAIFSVSIRPPMFNSWLRPCHRHRLDTLISIIASLSSRQLLLLQLSLPHSDKVKQLHGDCISYNKATTIKLLPVADNFYKTWSSHAITFITSCLDHITSQHALQKQVRRPLLCCCKFYVAATGF